MAVGDLDGATREAAWVLMDASYADMTRATFDEDLREKRHVILLRDDAGQLGGFSTITWGRHEVLGRRVAVVFSGDTVITPACWGQSALQRAFLRYIVACKLHHPLVPVYWFLVSKGYKTYLLLSRNFPVHWPRPDQPTPPFEAALLDHLARARFAARWDPRRGLVTHRLASGHLRENVAPIEPGLLARHPDIRFFAERNPGHAAGDELACLGLIEPRQWAYSLYRLARKRLAPGHGPGAP